MVAATNPLGRIDRFEHDALGNLRKVTRDHGHGRLNQMTLTDYNARGDIVSVTDPGGNLTTSAYDAARA